MKSLKKSDRRTPATEERADRWPALASLDESLRRRLGKLHDEGERIHPDRAPEVVDAFLDLNREGLRQVRELVQTGSSEVGADRQRRKLSRGIHTADKAAKLVLAPVDGRPAPTRPAELEPLLIAQRKQIGQLCEERAALVATHPDAFTSDRFEGLQRELSSALDVLEHTRAMQQRLAEVPRQSTLGKGSLVLKGSVGLAAPPWAGLVHDRGIDFRAADRRTGKRSHYRIHSTGLGVPFGGIGRNHSQDPTRCGWDRGLAFPGISVGKDAQHGVKVSASIPGLCSVMVTGEGEIAGSLLLPIAFPFGAGGSFFIGHPGIGHVVGPPLDGLATVGRGLKRAASAVRRT